MANNKWAQVEGVKESSIKKTLYNKNKYKRNTLGFFPEAAKTLQSLSLAFARPLPPGTSCEVLALDSSWENTAAIIIITDIIIIMTIIVYLFCLFVFFTKL